MRHRWRALLWDHDGTLVESEDLHWQHWNEVLRPWGVQLARSEYRAAYAGVPTAANAQRVLQTWTLSATADQLCELKNATTRAYLARQPFPAQPSAAQTLGWAQTQGFRMAVVTGTQRAAVDATLNTYGWAAYMETVVSFEDVRHSKPSPECYLLALARMGLKPNEALAIEDTEHGVAAATAAGLACVAVPTDMTALHDFSQATAVIPDLSALAEWVTNQAPV